MHLPEIDKFSHLKSPLHSWDPRVKIISILTLIFSVVLVQDLRGALPGIAVAFILLFLSRIPFSFVFLHLRWVLLFLGVFCLIICLTVPGSFLVKFGFLHVSREGIELSALVSLRAISAVILIFPMIGTTRFNLTLKALQTMKVPDKLIQLLMFSYRYIFLFLDEGQMMFVAATSRGWTKKTRFSTLKTMANLVGMLLVQSFERTEKIKDAMLSRGYSGKINVIDDFNLHPADFVKACLIMACAITLHFSGWIIA
ncbi:cobalt ECF transporter T component CbiQ [Candidatus Aerophobetes bacterium]|nr:cobalt ECF transporter T component CbiQ [Candidatus Aerophobetes bacterium]